MRPSQAWQSCKCNDFGSSETLTCGIDTLSSNDLPRKQAIRLQFWKVQTNSVSLHPFKRHVISSLEVISSRRKSFGRIVPLRRMLGEYPFSHSVYIFAVVEETDSAKWHPDLLLALEVSGGFGYYSLWLWLVCQLNSPLHPNQECLPVCPVMNPIRKCGLKKGDAGMQGGANSLWSI